MRRVAIALFVTVGAAALFAGCGGTSDTTTSGSGGGPAEAASTTAPAGTDGVYLPGVKQALASKNALPACQGQRSDEHICGNYFNYLLSWVANPKGGSPLLAGATNATGSPSGSAVFLPTEGADGGKTVQAGHHNDEGDGKYWWGPCGDDWTKCTGESKGARFTDRLLIEWSDDNANENSGSVYLNLQAGDVPLGQTWVGQWNDGQEGAGACKAADRHGWPEYVVCSWDGKNHDALSRSEDRQDELGFGYWFRDFPVRIAVRSKLPNSRIDIVSITADHLKIADASTVRVPSSIAVGASDEVTRYLVAFRRFNAAAQRDEVIIRGTLRSIPPTTTTSTTTTTATPPDKWDGSAITMHVWLGNEKVGSGGGTETKPTVPGSSCEIELASAEAAVHAPQCSISGAIAPGREGSLNDVQFFVR
ncbi:MAG: hypothetical protein ACOYL4_09670 [Miltoncostaeaceae bacterium]